MFGFCNHSWDKVNDIVIPSQADALVEMGLKPGSFQWNEF